MLKSQYGQLILGEVLYLCISNSWLIASTELLLSAFYFTSEAQGVLLGGLHTRLTVEKKDFLQLNKLARLLNQVLILFSFYLLYHELPLAYKYLYIEKGVTVQEANK